MTTISDDEAGEHLSCNEGSLNESAILSNDDDTVPAQRILKSRERNREHARRTRLRKKAQMQELQQRVKILEDERKALRQSIEKCSIASILLGLSGKSLIDEERGIATTSEEVSIASLISKRKRLATVDSSELIITVNGIETALNSNSKAHVNWKTGVYTDDQGVEHHLSRVELEAIRRERNRKHAKHTRLRKKAHLDCIRQEVSKLEDENRTMRNILSKHSPNLSTVVCEMPHSIRSLTFEDNVQTNSFEATDF